jgi:hypothetical protein
MSVCCLLLTLPLQFVPGPGNDTLTVIRLLSKGMGVLNSCDGIHLLCKATATLPAQPSPAQSACTICALSTNQAVRVHLLWQHDRLSSAHSVDWCSKCSLKVSCLLLQAGISGTLSAH